MKRFLDDDFLLGTATAVRLYRDHAQGQPVVDFHCHLDPAAIAEDRRFSDIVDLWVRHDPYKWRAMRINGIEERVITGEATDEERFAAWAETLPRLAGNPLFHWSQLELKRYFGTDLLLAPGTATEIRQHCNRRLAEPEFTARGLLRRARVETLCTSDDLLDDLAPHRAMRGEGGDIRMLPSLRGDSILAIDGSGFRPWLGRMEGLTGIAIDGLAAFEKAVSARLDLFEDSGCRFVDHGLDRVFFSPVPVREASRLFDRLLAGGALDSADAERLKTHILVFLGLEYGRRDWALQLHIGAHRQTSSRLRNLAGPAGGYACIGESSDVALVCRYLDALEAEGLLPRAILYTLNPSDSDMLASLTGSFAEDGVPGKIQFGPAWWYNDHRDGIRRQLRTLASLGLLSRFIGMTTDSRSLLSYSRHEYFRRILCDLLGGWVEAGELPADEDLLGTMVEDICIRTARRWAAPKWRD